MKFKERERESKRWTEPDSIKIFKKKTYSTRHFPRSLSFLIKIHTHAERDRRKTEYEKREKTKKNKEILIINMY